ncbi:MULTISPECIES: FkbM family methyltransferase [unclassified Moorena]|uniref:FkbM family methyltransferase n=1 Tax=unclassified Moorena TaxID=2683338 RepID=UPI0013FF4947|nr:MULTISPECIES: FkbM family methyltransferase [unclassified Moorena]NEO10824.1 FkbM family methyltransferase [Moorena sp. SIO3E8]NEO43523.1 FkbM family methyltransferase [Moorena sp. SIO4A3]NEP97485.1 FkbM family methyltransferase [Moorena sp. SIO3F7]
MQNLIQETKLPNGNKIFCLQEKEVPVLYKQIQGYIKYGIELHEGDIVFDVGANIGLFALWAYQKCHKNVSIYAFEPIPAIFNVLQANAQRFDSDKIKVLPCGLSQESKSITFAYNPNASMLSTAYPEELNELKNQLNQAIVRNLKQAPKAFRLLRWFPSFMRSLIIQNRIEKAFKSERVTCQLKTVSEIISEHNIEQIDLLKIDVEKSELDVLLGIEAQDWQKIKQIVVEVHDLEHRLQTITNLLKEHGLSEIQVEQEPIFHGSNVFNVYAWRG